MGGFVSGEGAARSAGITSLAQFVANEIKSTEQLKQEFAVEETENQQGIITAAQLNRPAPRPPSNQMNKDNKFKNRVDRKQWSTENSQKSRLKVNDLGKKAQEFAKRNPELDPQKLEDIIRDLRENMDEEEIAEVIHKHISDPYLAKYAFEFIIDSATDGESAFKRNVAASYEKHSENYAREIQIGENISDKARAFEDRGLDSPSKLRKWYHTAVEVAPGSVKTSDLFLKMLDNFGFNKLVKATHFYLASLGAELRKGVKMPVEEISDKVHQIRSFQAIINVFRVCSHCIRLVDKSMDYYSKRGIHEQLPEGFDFQTMAKTFMTIAQKRHVNVAEIIGTVRAQGFGSNEVILTMVIQQMSLMIPQVDAHRVFQSDSHKADIQKAFLECLTEQYTKFTPEEENVWISEELLPEGLEEDIAALQIEESDLRSVQSDTEELKAFMSAYDGLLDSVQ